MMVKNLLLSTMQEPAEACVREAITDNDEHRTDTECAAKISKGCVDVNVFFNKIKGLPMGSLASVFLAELTMQKIEESILGTDATI